MKTKRLIRHFIIMIAAVMALSLMTVTAMADDEAETISLGDEKAVTLTEANSSVRFMFAPTEDGVYQLTSESRGVVDEYPTATIFSEDPEGHTDLAGDDTKNGHKKLGFAGKKGWKYEIVLNCALEPGKKCELTLKLEKADVASCVFEPAEPYKVMEESVGSYDEDINGNRYFEYALPQSNIGDKLTVTDSKDNVKTYVFHEYDEEHDCSYFLNQDDPQDYIFEGDVSRISNQFDVHWKLGKDNYMTIKYFGFECKVPVEVTENPYESITLVPAKTYTVIENVSGNWAMDENDKPTFFVYEFPEFNAGDVLTVTKKDGTVQTYTYKASEWGFVNDADSDDVIDGDLVAKDGVQDEDDHWERGKKNVMTVSYCGRTFDVDVEIVQKQPMKVTQLAKKKTYKVKTIKKRSKAFRAVKVTGAEGKVTYKLSGNKKSKKALKFTAKTGKITVKKGTKKGTYKLKITASAAGNADYAPGSKSVTVTVVVKK